MGDVIAIGRKDYVLRSVHPQARSVLHVALLPHQASHAAAWLAACAALCHSQVCHGACTRSPSLCCSLASSGT